MCEGIEFPFRNIYCERVFWLISPTLSILFEFHFCGISIFLIFCVHKDLNNRVLGLQLVPAHLIVELAEVY